MIKLKYIASQESIRLKFTKIEKVFREKPYNAKNVVKIMIFYLFFSKLFASIKQIKS